MKGKDIFKKMLAALREYVKVHRLMDEMLYRMQQSNLQLDIMHQLFKFDDWQKREDLLYEPHGTSSTPTDFNNDVQNMFSHLS